MDRVLLDTNVFSFVFKGDRRGALYEPLVQGGETYLSFQTVAELHLWVKLA